MLGLGFLKQASRSCKWARSRWNHTPTRRALVLVGTLGITWQVDRVWACGIIGYVGDEPAVKFLLEGLQILQNRGYDSAGVATLEHGIMTTSKFASAGSTSDSLQILQATSPRVNSTGTTGIAHTRWATHGGKTDDNAHPHCDQHDRVAIVHNGTIENYAELKADLIRKGVVFKSQTDSEVIAQLIGQYLDRGEDSLTAVKKTLRRLSGTWGLVVMFKDTPGQIVAARNGSPLVVGLGDKRTFVASEVSAFSRYTSNYIALSDGEIAVIKADGVSLDLSRMQKAPEEEILLSPAPFKHWTLKEIFDQPEAIMRCLGYGGRFSSDGKVKLGGLDANSELLLPIRNLMFSACGTSLFASMYGVLLAQNLRAFDTVYALDAAEVTVDSFPRQNAGLVVISQSGETKDTHRSMQAGTSAGIPTFSVVNQVGSLIARSTNCGVYLNAGREHAVASTKAFTTQVTALAMIAAWFSQHRASENASENAANAHRREEMINALHRLPISAGMTLQQHEKCKKIAEKLVNAEHMFVLGKGYSEPIAREGALKLKEITYVHAEGYGGGALKHGPFALLQDGTPVVLLIMDDPHAELMRMAAHEVQARGAHTIIITDNPRLADGLAEDVITIPSNGPLTALLATIPLQLIAYELSVLKGIDPDKPRNLAKAVTVD